MSGNQQTLSTTLRQEQQLSARQLQSLELLNLPLLELEERLMQAMAANPLLEAESADDLPEPELRCRSGRGRRMARRPAAALRQLRPGRRRRTPRISAQLADRCADAAGTTAAGAGAFGRTREPAAGRRRDHRRHRRLRLSAQHRAGHRNVHRRAGRSRRKSA